MEVQNLYKSLTENLFILNLNLHMNVHVYQRIKKKIPEIMVVDYPSIGPLQTGRRLHSTSLIN